MSFYDPRVELQYAYDAPDNPYSYSCASTVRGVPVLGANVLDCAKELYLLLYPEGILVMMEDGSCWEWHHAS